MPPSLIKTKDFDVILKKSARRQSVTLKVSTKGVFLHMPTRLPIDIAHDLIEEKSYWIKQQLAKQPEPQP